MLNHCRIFEDIESNTYEDCKVGAFFWDTQYVLNCPHPSTPGEKGQTDWLVARVYSTKGRNTYKYEDF